MGFGPTEEFLTQLKQLQAEGKIISAAELVRRMKAGAGLESLGNAQRSASTHETAQQGIGVETLAAANRWENVWTGQGGEAARGSFRPLADLAASASAALHSSQNILTDQAHAFALTRDSLHEVSDDPPQRTVWDVITPWDTDNEDRINERNAAIQQNNAVYKGFTSTSDEHARQMPVDYGQVPSTAGATYTVQPAPASGRVAGKQNHGRRPVGPGHTNDSSQAANQPGQAAQPGIDTTPTDQPGAEPRPDERQAAHVPAAPDRKDGTSTAGYTPPSAEVPVPPEFPASAEVPYPPEPSPASYHGLPVPGGEPVAGPGSYHNPGADLPLESSGPSWRGGPAAPGKATGTGRFGGTPEPRGGTGPGATGPRGANGMPIATGNGKGDKERDEEHKTPEYLQEADPNGLFGYDGKPTPPVIGK